MPVSVTLLICLFLLCCTGSARTFSARLSIFPGWIAAWSLLIAAMSAFTLPVTERFSIGVAPLVIIVTCVLLCARDGETQVTVMLSFLCGILSWFLQRVFPGFIEPALVLSLPAVLLSLPLPLTNRQKALCQALSPIFFGLVATLEEWYLFDIAVFSIGSPMQLDTQIFGLVALFAVWSVRPFGAKKRFDAQKEY